MVATQALADIRALEENPKLRDYYLLLAVRGHLLLELGRDAEAAREFSAALTLPCSEPERRFLRRKLESCESDEASRYCPNSDSNAPTRIQTTAKPLVP